jgi:hypothetical protein
MPTDSKKRKCLMPKCSRKQVARGQCSRCYRTTAALVATGQTTWEQVEAKGLATPAYERQATSAKPVVDTYAALGVLNNPHPQQTT